MNVFIIVETIAAILIVVLLLLVRPTFVRGRSMMPTIHNGEILVVDVSPWQGKKPQRYSVVVVRGPGRLLPQLLKLKHVRIKELRRRLPAFFLLKRIIGLPGDSIEIRNGLLIVNGEAFNEPYVLSDSGRDFGPIRIPEDACFVLGDNRYASRDSRSFGVLPLKNIVGTVWKCVYPKDNIRSIAIGNP